MTRELRRMSVRLESGGARADDDRTCNSAFGRRRTATWNCRTEAAIRRSASRAMAARRRFPVATGYEQVRSVAAHLATSRRERRAAGAAGNRRGAQAISRRRSTQALHAANHPAAEARAMPERIYNVLFLCNRQFARSIIAEAILKPDRRRKIPWPQRRVAPQGRGQPEHAAIARAARL